MGFAERVSRGMRTVLIVAAPACWVAAVLCSVLLGVDVRIAAVFTGMALAGTLCGQMRERDERTIATLGCELADATRPAHQDGPRLRGLPGAR